MENYFDEIPWIPVRGKQGVETLTLKAFLLRADEFDSFAIASHTKRAALWLSLICWSAAAVHRENLDRENWQLTDVVEYLNKHRDWFRLERFLQVPASFFASEKKDASFYTLEADLEQGNNQSFFTKTSYLTQQDYDAARIGLILVEGHWYGVPGKGGGLGKKNEEFTSCPAALCLVSIRRRMCIGEDIIINTDMIMSEKELDDLAPAWERTEADFPLKLDGLNYSGNSPLYMWFGLGRCFKVLWKGNKAKELKSGNGYKIKELLLWDCPLFVKHTYKKGKNGDLETKNAKPDPKKAIWRALPSVIESLKSGREVVFEPEEDALVLEVFGLYSKQAKISGSTHSTFHIPYQIIKDSYALLHHLKSGLDIFESGSSNLRSELKKVSEGVMSRGNKLNKETNNRIRSFLDRSAAFDFYWDRCSRFYLSEFLPSLTMDPLSQVKRAEEVKNRLIKEAVSIFLSELPKTNAWFKITGFVSGSKLSISESEGIR